MTTRPRFAEFDRSSVAGLAAVALFLIMAAVFLTAQFTTPQGFPADASVMEGIGFALFDIAGDGIIESEGFLAAFEIVDVVLVAALVGAVMLARREDSDVSSLLTDGGRREDGDSRADRDADEGDGGDP